MLRLAVLAAVVGGAGCRALIGIDEAHVAADAADVDAALDAGPGAGTCYGTLVRICLTAAPTGAADIAGQLDTSQDPRCTLVHQANGPDMCVVAAASIHVQMTTVTGTLPLVLLATDTITVEGALDASSRRGSTAGPGATMSACASGSGAAVANGGGGAGGSLGKVGGRGGNGGGNGGGNPGGTALPAIAPNDLRAGCAGGSGGAAASPASGGQGGGAVALISAGPISISAAGAVFASGAGGDGAGSPLGLQGGGGGGGAGSGGMIILDGSRIDVLGIVAANGGGGGGGAGTALGGSGSPGADGATTQYSTPASGGTGGASGGGTGGTAGNAGQNANGGGGGGGGGAGYIWVSGILTGTQISPDPTMSSN